MARNRRKLTSFYKRVHVPNFSFDDTSDLEDNEDPSECLLSGKLHIENVRFCKIATLGVGIKIIFILLELRFVSNSNL